MSYSLLGQDLHETAEHARNFFAQNYSATGFKCEQAVLTDLPLRPTWQARLKSGYSLCVNVQPSPFTPTVYEFVARCAQKNLAIKFWVAVAAGASKESFSNELKRAREVGIGVLEINADGSVQEFHSPVALSLFALQRTDLSKVPKALREEIKTAETSFLDGMPTQGCQTICQELEAVTRRFGEYAFDKGWWKVATGTKPPKLKFFRTDAWAKLLEEMETKIDYNTLRPKCPAFTRQLIVNTRAFTDWRNTVSHKPRSAAELQRRDLKLRSMFEMTTSLLLDWHRVTKPLKL